MSWVLVERTLIATGQPEIVQRRSFVSEIKAMDEVRALDRAEETRRRKTPDQGPVLLGVTLEREDGGVVEWPELRRQARLITD